ncbi:response regulator [Paenibacillus sp. DXFW5]|uniref:Response regulator n=1 Tax=Paenibacillus rhizolycopersici TaxID=2780073 RepID=A0ABS2H7F7_9BACL|nr:response regulator [Paenibacillus rhizolycopersici]MBM6995736.1 response regulator [Paenibacillus rhizolycopersici]
MEKLKVLIVDDEHLIRNLIRMRMDWEQEGFEIVGEAPNAQEAMELVEQVKPDVILTDIYMPNIDGIEFSRSVLEKYPQIKIVVVSGHDEFEYAQQSIKIGVFDFLLKPIRAADLLHVTGKLKRKIEEERSREGELARLKEELARNLPYLREKFLLQWLQGTLSREEIREQAEYFQLPAFRQEAPYQIAVVEITPIAEKHTEEQLILLGMACKRKLELFFQGDPFVTMLLDTRNQFVLISFRPEGDLAGICEALLDRLIHAPKGIVNIGVGRKRHSLQEGHLGYAEACNAIRYKAFVGNNQVICYEDMVDNREETYRSNPELLRQLQFYISVGSSDRAVELLQAIFDVSFSSVSQFRMAAMDVIHECQHAAMEQQLEGEQGLDTETLVSIITADNLPELVQALEPYVLHVAKAISTKRQAKEGNLIYQVQAYLEQNLGDPGVGLASTAAAFFVSPGHLGRLMKKETGQTFVEYLTNLRMKKAECLLKTTDFKGYEIGERVGITDPHYFSILFKKATGRSMNEYRNA